MPTFSINLSLLKSLLALATVIEARDPYTGGHTWRVSRYAMKLAERAGLSPDEVFVAYLGGMVHDIGKVGIADAILNKRGPLTRPEYEIIQKHPDLGDTLTRDHPLRELILDILLQHHERYDGGGYPRRLGGEEISFLARTLAIADAFDAMTSTRPYRPGMQARKAYDILVQESGKQFDPELVPYFVDMGLGGDLDHILGHSADERLMLTCSECGPIVAAPRRSRSGDHVVCPGCRGNYLLHGKGDSFEMEWLQTIEAAWVPQPDADAIEDAAELAPLRLRLPDSQVIFRPANAMSYTV